MFQDTISHIWIFCFTIVKKKTFLWDVFTSNQKIDFLIQYFRIVNYLVLGKDFFPKAYVMLCYFTCVFWSFQSSHGCKNIETWSLNCTQITCFVHSVNGMHHFSLVGSLFLFWPGCQFYQVLRNNENGNHQLKHHKHTLLHISICFLFYGRKTYAWGVRGLPYNSTV